MTAEGGSSQETMSSPKNRVKFLCSHSGKIMPRPSDGQLKYVGGETRVVAVPRDIDFSGLMNKLSGMCDGDMVLKYQLVPDEFNILVSVKCDEDLHHMLAEYDRQEANSTEGVVGSPRLRTFLFASHPIVLDRQPSSSSSEAQEVEQRYVDAVNGVLRAPLPTTTTLKRSSLSNGRSIFSISSAGSSPTSAAQPDNNNNTCPNDSIINTHDVFTSNGLGNCHLNKGAGFQRVNSSPSLYNLGQQSHYYPTQQQQQQQPYGHHSYRLPSSNNGTGRLVSASSVGRSDFGRCQVGHANPATNARYYTHARHLKGAAMDTQVAGIRTEAWLK